MNQASKCCFCFGEYSLNAAERLLLRNGQAIPLAPKVFDTLVLLVENAGHLVEKDEFMAKLWPGTFVGEDALARNISILRKALGGTSDSQSLIVTVPTRGYRFEAVVREWRGQGEERENGRTSANEGDRNADLARPPVFSAAEASPADHAGVAGRADLHRFFGSRSWRSLAGLGLLALAAGTLAGIVTYGLLSSPPAPRVARMERLTFSGRVDPWPRLVTDGVRIYFLERWGDHWNLMQVPISGGESHVISTPFKNAVALDVSPGRANLLMGSFEEREVQMPLWVWPIQGGAFKRVGDITAYQAVWHPNGRQIVYAEDDGLYIANADGTNARKFVATDGRPVWLSWSPDGKRLRFETASAQNPIPREWEIRSDGEVLHSFLMDSTSLPKYDFGVWSAGGRYFFTDPTRLTDTGRTDWRDLWATREKRTLFHFRHTVPVRLTNGPMSYEGVTRGKDEQKLLVVGIRNVGNLERYDLKSQRTTEFLPGLCAHAVSFSPSGQWLACKSADGTILRMKPDGSERLVLATPSVSGYGTRWSPDGKQVAFSGTEKDGRTMVFVVSATGGVPRKVFPDNLEQSDPAWSPDGKFLVFARYQNDSSSSSLWLLNLATKNLSLLPGSQTMRYPAWSPDGRRIAAITEDWHKLMLFDVGRRKWAQLAESIVLNGDSLQWSRDGKYLYFQDLLGKDESIYRICMRDRKPQLAISLAGLLAGGVHRAYSYGFAPDGSLIVAVDRGGADIYALDLDLP